MSAPAFTLEADRDSWKSIAGARLHSIRETEPVFLRTRDALHAAEADAAQLRDALREMLTAFSLETEYQGPEAAAMARLAAKKHARAALAKVTP